MIGINRHTLANGLRIVHSRNAATQMAAVNLLYRVGSRNEDVAHTGMAHLLEHLMFGGSENAPDFDGILQEAGGENNAWTSCDLTNYYEVLPVCNVETALWIEADRMRRLSLTDRSLEVQRSVVMEEFKQRCMNVPYGDIGHLWRSLAYEKHPYRWPVIGKVLSDIREVGKPVIKEFYDRFYVPDNAILAVVGNIEPEEVFAMAEKWFGGIPSGGYAKAALPAEPEQTERRELVVEREVPAGMLVKAYRMCARMDGDYAACDLLSDVLSNGRSSRLYRRVFSQGDLVSSIDASITGSVDEGMLIVKAQLLPGVDFGRVEEAIETEFDRLRNGDVGEPELEKNVNRFESNALFSNFSNDERAANLAYYEMLGDADLINREIELYRAVSADRLTAVAQKVLREENCSVLYYKSKRG